MTQALLDLGRTQNQINLAKAKGREALDANLEARKARQEARGMKDGFDPDKVTGISMNEQLEKRAKAQAEDAAQATPEAPTTEEPK